MQRQKKFLHFFVNLLGFAIIKGKEQQKTWKRGIIINIINNLKLKVMKKMISLAVLMIATVISATAATKGSWPTNVCKFPSWPVIEGKLPKLPAEPKFPKLPSWPTEPVASWPGC